MSTYLKNSSTPLQLTGQPPSTKQCGFSLVEMAIVLVIVGLLATGGLAILASQQDMRRVQDTQTLMDSAKEALIGFAATHNPPYLPCPDTTGNGQENRTGSACSTGQEGNLPWVTLGLTDSDSWGNRFRYRVTAAFSNSATGMTLASTGDITINNAAGIALATGIPAIILSHGKNGFGAQNSSGGTNLAPPGANELENTNTNTTFVSNPLVGTGGTGGEFDDIVTWISPNILFSRMLAAGRLP
ncbi:MAG: type II secretion system protein [Sideroxydans sp.]|nr:type II secretion system protein [Sideroxydans sp.]